MRHIKKGAEPSDWLRFCKQKPPEPRFDDGPKASLRAALLAASGHLCCYCMRRICDRPGAMKIEHWAPRSLSPELALDFSNLLAACDGGEGQAASEQHCDTSKGSTPIALDPRRADCIRLVVCTSRGEMVGTSAAGESVAADIAVLGLNQPRLRAGRRAALEEIQAWANSKAGTRTRRQLEERVTRVETPDAEGGETRSVCRSHGRVAAQARTHPLEVGKHEGRPRTAWELVGEKTMRDLEGNPRVRCSLL